jgi:hypothetical protein
VLSDFEDPAHGRKVWQLRCEVRNAAASCEAHGIRSMTLDELVSADVIEARLDADDVATLDELVALRYVRAADGLPQHVRAASAVRSFGARLVIVQDDVDALAVRDEGGAVEPVLLPARSAGHRVFDDAMGNKHRKLDLEACVVLEDGRLVAFGSGLTPAREHVVVWDGAAAPRRVAARAFYSAVRVGALGVGARLNVEGAVAILGHLLIFHRGNDVTAAGSVARNLIVALDLAAFVRWLDGAGEAPPLRSVTTVELGDIEGVPLTFTDAVAVAEGCVVVLACAEDSADAIADGPVLGSRVGMLRSNALRMVDVRDATGARSRLKLEGIERRPASRFEFDVVADMDRPEAPAQLGRLCWRWE